jgi:hypothetical protein
MKLKTHFLIASLFISSAILSGCGGSSAATLPDPTISFINFVPDAALDFQVNDDVKFSNVQFADNAGNFQSVAVEEIDYVIFENGSTVPIDISSTNSPKNANELYVALGLKNFGTETEKRARLTNFAINRVRPNATKSRVYAFNAYVRANGNQNFAVEFKNPGQNPSINFAAIPFGGNTAQDLDAAPITLVAQRQFTETDVASITKTLESGKIYLMVLTGIEGAVGVTAPQIKFFELQPRD